MTATWALKAWKNSQQALSSLLQTEQQHSHSPLPRHPGFFPSCSGRLLLGLATLEPSLFGLRLGLGHGLLGLALALVGVALALHGSWLLGCSLRFGLVEQSWSQLMEHGHPAEGNPSMGAHAAGKWHSWQPCA